MAIAVEQIHPVAHLPLVLGVLRRLEVATMIDHLIPPHPAHSLSCGHGVEAMVLAFKLTLREAEVLYWVVKGKTNRDIGDILGTSPATVKKHLEHVFVKLGVETRTAAANLAMSRVRPLTTRVD